MTKREYAEAIAREINGAEVTEVEKANGVVFMGIIIKEDGNNVAPTCYVDKMYEDNVPVEEAVKHIMELAETNKLKLNIDWIDDWELAKGNITARLYNKATKAEVFRSAKRYGYDDLIIVPYINIPEASGSAKVTKKMFELWNVSKDKLFRTALANAKKDVSIMSMTKMIASLQPQMASLMYGGDIDDLPEIEIDGQNIVTNENKWYGAISVIFSHDRLMEIYSDGYIVLPSSVHEVIVLPYSEDEEFSNMVSEVNETNVAAEEVLGHRAYLFKKEEVE